MHILIDSLTLILLLLFSLVGWKKGSLLSALGILRVIFSYGAAYFAGRYLGDWLAETTNRPRIVAIPVIAITTLLVVSVLFSMIVFTIKERRQQKKEKQDFKLPIASRLGGSIINLSTGAFSLALLFWLIDLLIVGASLGPVSGADQSNFVRFARRTVYEITYCLSAKEGQESQAATLSEMISHPAEGMERVEKILTADSVQQLISDPQFTEDLLSGDPAQIEQNTSLQQLFDDQDTLNTMRELGLFSGKEKKSELCEKLSRFGQNETIQTSIENLKSKEMFSADKIPSLIRDPDFDAIIAEIVN